MPILLIIAILASSIVSYNFNNKSKAHKSDKEITHNLVEHLKQIELLRQRDLFIAIFLFEGTNCQKMFSLVKFD